MAKDKIAYVCSNCGQESAKWMGRCPNCGEWNTFKQIRIPANTQDGTQSWDSESNHTSFYDGLPTGIGKPVKLRDISASDEPRIDMHDTELNRVLGGGMVPGSIILLGGEPGIGKSTLTLQTILHMHKHPILYVSGEESTHQIKLRADRLASNMEIPDKETIGSNISILCETSIEKILEYVKSNRPGLIIIDSIQTMSTEKIGSSPGSISQVRECASTFFRLAKTSGIPIILIGHINKEGTLAGPKILEHIVDTVIQFEGDTHYMYRILRSTKNRFGSTSELGIYEMEQDGLKPVSKIGRAHV